MILNFLIQSNDKLKSDILKSKQTINCRGQLVDLSKPLIMGIINTTPDSFYAASRYQETKEVLVQVENMISEGATIIDLGACSTRPGAKILDAKTEKDRLKPVLESIRKYFPDVILSLDTYRSEVARWGVNEFGVDIINDISGGSLDSKMFETVGELSVPYILTHIQGNPAQMQDCPDYLDIISEISDFFVRSIEKLKGYGVKDIILDPGFGFGKTIEQNYQILNNAEKFSIFQLPLLVGVSRKSMIWKALNCKPEEALTGTIALNSIALQKGFTILRVHDVRPADDLIRLFVDYL